jgi:3-methyladenine DNA glycosylase AlkD
MTTLEKAAKEAAEEIQDAPIIKVSRSTGEFRGINDDVIKEIILRHLEPVKKELDEARELMSSPHIKHERIPEREPECWPSCIKCKAQRWLERNKGGK